jgi:hypothetical protein
VVGPRPRCRGSRGRSRGRLAGRARGRARTRWRARCSQWSSVPWAAVRIPDGRAAGGWRTEGPGARRAAVRGHPAGQRVPGLTLLAATPSQDCRSPFFWAVGLPELARGRHVLRRPRVHPLWQTQPPVEGEASTVDSAQALARRQSLAGRCALTDLRTQPGWTCRPRPRPCSRSPSPPPPGTRPPACPVS